ncbi:MAG: 16S rRNA (uracil(1498)-N(3))-methyltransferase [candidate division WOR-3 bacterium]|nr:MAG: 16S rRNA (uracil(1498)-N(3))-methyltransferase [candidate division WOR-3 bacterium]
MKDHNIFYIPPDFYKGDEVAIPRSQYQHITRVLRKKRGERISLTDGCGYRYDVELGDVTRSEMHARIVSREFVARRTSLQLTLGFVPVKGSRNDTVIEKGTELGVVRFIMFISERSVLRKFGAQKLDRLHSIAQSAMIQSQQYYMPEIVFAPSIKHMLEARKYERIVLADQHGAMDVPLGANRLLLLIGPEGGFSDEERDDFVGRGASLLRLGYTRLRSETAAIVGVTKILAAYGEL